MRENQQYILTQIDKPRLTFDPPSIVVQRHDAGEAKPEESPANVPIV